MTEEIPDVNDALNEYFRLKSKFENEINSYKRKIINNPSLSKREKRAEYLKLVPKCINCKRPSKIGTLFSTSFHPATDKNEAHRLLKASCGNLADPCNLQIEIHLNSADSIENLIRNIQKEITDSKNLIINDKNKLLFGLITTETALDNFENNKTYINELTSIYEIYVDRWNKKIDNPEKQRELEESLISFYDNVKKIKECIQKMNETGDKQFAVDAANIYYKMSGKKDDINATSINNAPLLTKIRKLKYSENIIYNDDSTNTYRLLQSKSSLDDIIIGASDDKVIHYDVGFKSKIPPSKKRPAIIIDSDSQSGGLKFVSQDMPMQINSTHMKNYDKTKPVVMIEQDEPIIGQGKDGIDWNMQEYKSLWNIIPSALKNEFKLNIDWMKEFMHKCVNDKTQSGFNGCQLTTPPNIVIPPRKMDNGQYDFGVSIYNKVFNKLPETTQNTYLTFYKEDPNTKEKDYKTLEDALNKLVEVEVSRDSDDMIFG